MYSIYAGDLCIYNDQFALPERTVINPKLVLEDNSAGSLTFTLPVTNVGYNSITRLATDISVLKEGKEIWAGRVLSETMDFRNSRALTCEGALAFLNDSTQPPKEYKGDSVRNYIIALLNIHNSKVAANRQFKIGTVTVVETDPDIVYYTNYEKTIESINKNLVERLGGHLRVRRENDGYFYLDYLADYPKTSTQAIEFGKNLVDFTKKWDESEYASVVIPLGARLEGKERTARTDVPEALDAYLTVESENGGRLYVKSDEAVETFGWIEKAVIWEDVTTAKALLEKGRQYLEDLQFDNVELELSALDLHYLNVDVDAVELLDQIQVTSRPHGMNRVFPVTKMDIPLDKPASTVFKLGMSEKTSLTSSSNQANSKILQKIENLPKAHTLLKEAQITATSIMNMATNGYVTIIKDEEGSEALYISNTKDYRDATQLWKWSLSGLGYWTNAKEEDPANRTKKFGELTEPFFGMAMTMDGAIVADFITAGTMSADRVRTGVLQSENRHVVFDLTNGKLTMKSGSIHIGTTEAGETAFEVDEQGNLIARKGTFIGSVTATDSFIEGTVQAKIFKLWNGQSLVDLIDEAGKIKGDWLNLMGLTIINKAGDVVLTISEDGIRWSSKTSPVKYQFSANSTGPWHDTMQTSDKYRRDSTDGGATWGSPYQFKGTDGTNGKNGSVDYSRVNKILKETYGITTTYITDSSIGSPVIRGAEIYGGKIYAGTGGENANFAMMTGDGFEVYRSGIRTPKFKLYVTDPDITYGPEAVHLTMGSGDQNGDGRFHIVKAESFVRMYYDTTTKGATVGDAWCGFEFGNDKTIRVFGDMQVNAVWA